MSQEIVKSILIVLGLSGLTIYSLHHLRIPPIAGFLISGLFVGPSGLGLISDQKDVEVLSEIGIILLMFTLGLELSGRELLALRREMWKGGPVYVLLGLLSGLFTGIMIGLSAETALFYGSLLALSSTAIVSKHLLDRGEVSSPHGNLSLGILLFQDLCVVPFTLVVGFLAGEATGVSGFFLTMGKAVLVLAIVLLSARWFVPLLLKEVVRTRSRELFLLFIILICVGIAFFCSAFGLSYAVGAFLAGVAISESEYASQAISEILPLKETFSGLFFVSIGMLVDFGFLREHIYDSVLFLCVTLALKAIVGTASAILIRYPLRPSIQAALYLSQIGEFSFVLALEGMARNLIDRWFYQLFLTTSVASMVLSPFFLMASPHIATWVSRRVRVRRLRRTPLEQRGLTKMRDHVIIVGFGLNGRNLARVLKEVGIPYVVVEMNPEIVRKMKLRGEPLYYGDGTSVEIMRRLGLLRARVLVVAISDAASARRIVAISRRENPKIYIIVRTRYVGEVEGLLELGADEVVPEEFETSIEIFSRVLSRYEVARNVINDYIEAIREGSYVALRTQGWEGSIKEPLLRGIEVQAYLVKEGSALSGNSIKDLKVRAKTGATILAVRRGDEIYPNPKAEFVLNAGDVIWLIGKREEILHAFDYFDSERFIVERY